MGEVYRATDSKLGREVAIKLIPEDFARDATRMARFTREAQVLASLNHPNIAAIYGVEDRALIMELVEGQTLSERIKQGPFHSRKHSTSPGRSPTASKPRTTRASSTAISSPPTSRSRRAGIVKLLDFGLAKAEGPWTCDGVGRGRTDADGGVHRRGRDPRHRRLHGARAGARPERRQARRHLGLRRDPLRDAHRRADVRGRHGHRRPRLGGASGSRSQARAGKGPATARSAVSRRIRRGGCAMPATRCCCSTPHRPRRSRRRRARRRCSRSAASRAPRARTRRRVIRALPRDTAGRRRRAIPGGLPDNVNFTQWGVSAISPDGRKIAFAAYGYDSNLVSGFDRSIRRRPHRSIDARINQQTVALFWSPDSRFVAYGDSKQLKKIDVNGGPPQTLAEIAPVSAARGAPTARFSSGPRTGS